jgi:LuxR family transcriptional regulator, maltose regulon positive regulatory protein
VDEGPPMVELLERMQDAGGRMQAYVHTLLAAFGRHDAVQPASFIPQPLIEPLSERELEVLRLVAQGLSNRQISARLCLAVSTVKGHNQRIFAKLQVQSRTEALVRARELGLV